MVGKKTNKDSQKKQKGKAFLQNKNKTKKKQIHQLFIAKKRYRKIIYNHIDIYGKE